MEYASSSKKSAKIAFIGGGWNTIQIAKVLLEEGYCNLTIYEKFDNLGGTWHPELAYGHLKVHSAGWSNYFKDFPHPDSTFEDRQFTAEQMHEYLLQYAKKFGITPLCKFKHTVIAIHQNTSTKTASLTVMTDDSIMITKEGYDLVLFSSMAAEPSVPTHLLPKDFNKRGFVSGVEVMHSSSAKSADFDRWVSEKANVVVVGAGKSSVDQVVGLQRLGLPINHIHWIFRKPYLFLRYEKVYHKQRKLLDSTVAQIFIFASLIAAFSSKISARLLQFFGYLKPVHGKPHKDLKCFHLGILTKEDFNLAKKVLYSIADIVKITTSNENKPGIHVSLKSDNANKFIPCDVVLLCTGYGTGFKNIDLFIDGVKYSPDNYTPLFNHLIFPKMPNVGLCHTATFTFGPSRGVPTADMIIRYLLTDAVKRTPEFLAKAAQKNWARTGIYATDILNGSNGNTVFFQQSIRVLIDFWLSGLTGIFCIIRTMSDYFIRNKLSYLRIKK